VILVVAPDVVSGVFVEQKSGKEISNIDQGISNIDVLVL
jgi:hypothetical protein